MIIIALVNKRLQNYIAVVCALDLFSLYGNGLFICGGVLFRSPLVAFIGRSVLYTPCLKKTVPTYVFLRHGVYISRRTGAKTEFNAKAIQGHSRSCILGSLKSRTACVSLYRYMGSPLKFSKKHP